MASTPLPKPSLQTQETNFTSKKISEVRMLRKSKNWLQKKRYPFLGLQKNPSLR